ncbi:hypothetical protein Tco_0013056 [Tanacetum coccineum]
MTSTSDVDDRCGDGALERSRELSIITGSSLEHLVIVGLDYERELTSDVEREVKLGHATLAISVSRIKYGEGKRSEGRGDVVHSAVYYLAFDISRVSFRSEGEVITLGWSSTKDKQVCGNDVGQNGDAWYRSIYLRVLHFESITSLHLASVLDRLIVASSYSALSWKCASGDEMMLSYAGMKWVVGVEMERHSGRRGTLISLILRAIYWKTRFTTWWEVVNDWTDTHRSEILYLDGCNGGEFNAGGVWDTDFGYACDVVWIEMDMEGVTTVTRDAVEMMQSVWKCFDYCDNMLSKMHGLYVTIVSIMMIRRMLGRVARETLGIACGVVFSSHFTFILLDTCLLEIAGEERLTIELVEGREVEKIVTAVTKNGVVTRYPGKFHEYQLTEKEKEFERMMIYWVQVEYEVSDDDDSD